MGKAISMICFILGLIFTVTGGAIALHRGTIANDWTGIVGLGFAISQIAMPVNISKIIQNLKGMNSGGKEYDHENN